MAVTLSREDDIDAVPAWLELDRDRRSTDPWTDVVAVAATTTVERLEGRGVLLGLPVAVLPTSDAPAADVSCGLAGLPVRAIPYGLSAQPAEPLLVVDLSSLWAGPLCSHLLDHDGARVVKVESQHRPDGARSGSPAFFDLMNGGKQSVVLDFRANDGDAPFDGSSLLLTS